MTQFKFNEYVYPKKLPWEQIFTDIEGHLSPTQISDLLGSGWSCFQRLRNSKEPKHSVGESILIIHTRYCGEDLTNQRITEAE